MPTVGEVEEALEALRVVKHIKDVRARSCPLRRRPPLSRCVRRMGRSVRAAGGRPPFVSAERAAFPRGSVPTPSASFSRGPVRAFACPVPDRTHHLRRMCGVERLLRCGAPRCATDDVSLPFAFAARRAQLDGPREALDDEHDASEERAASQQLSFVMRAQLDAMWDDEAAARGVLDEGTEALSDAMGEIEDLQRQLAALRELSAAQEVYIARAEEEEREARSEAQEAMGKTKQLAAAADAAGAEVAALAEEMRQDETEA